MCETCGCGQTEDFTIHTHTDAMGNTYTHSHGDGSGEHDHHDESRRDTMSHDHHDESHQVTPGHAGHDHQDIPHPEETKRIDINKDILSVNNLVAERNRGFFRGRGVLCLNLVSSPGSGKTTILEKTIPVLSPQRKIYVIEGDQQTSRDADRINSAGAPAVQVNTGTGCHLDARMVSSAVEKLDPAINSVLFIENVGNLVCPALFDLGENMRVVVVSVTEGDDKPLKYPYMFASSQLCLINKTDLLPYVDFSPETFMQNALRINSRMTFICLSAKTGEGMNEWISALKQKDSYG